MRSMAKRGEPHPTSFRDTILREQEIADAAMGRVAARIIAHIPDLNAVIADLELAGRQFYGSDLLNAIKQQLKERGG